MSNGYYQTMSTDEKGALLANPFKFIYPLLYYKIAAITGPLWISIVQLQKRLWNFLYFDD